MTDLLDRSHLGEWGATTRDRIVVRFAGDSGDGIQLLGTETAKATALSGHDLMTLPDFPAEIRAPVGTTFGVSAYQIQFGGPEILTSGDAADVLVAFNPAALKTNLHTLRPGGLLIVDKGSLTKRGLEKAGYAADPTEDGSLAGYRMLLIDITGLTAVAVAASGVGKKQAGQSKNFWALGLVFWMFGHDRAATRGWIEAKFKKTPETAAANTAALDAGHAYGETAEIGADIALRAAPAKRTPGLYRTVTGTDAMAMGLAAVAACSGLKVSYCTYPITPASALLHVLARLRGQGVVTFQAEDEIAAVCAAVGASYAGGLGVTGSSGPGMALKAEAMGLAVAAELPLIAIDVQRAGPSTGMPTKAEQGDLTMAIHGRHGEAPCCVLAPATPSDCFDAAIEAARIAIGHMTPVIILSDAYIANAAEPWRVPDADALPDITPVFRTDPAGFQPFLRDAETLARPWVRPGTPELVHRIGGLERSADTGHISYDPANHDRMTRLRDEKIARIAETAPPARIEEGPESGDILVVGWGSTYGPLKSATRRVRARGHAVGHLHLRMLWPLPRGLEDILRSFKRIVVAEMNSGQLREIIRARFLLPAEGFNQVTGQPLKSGDVEAHVLRMLED
ncbi:MAG: 2-oxoacid:acceptor oxidoreductase subunit alpha [Rhodospirillaceae bacterium]|nr:2-oxoacid:acceptor oxidoreductase subunit alpha [Rhodospirillaceae bacterium]